MKTCRMLSLLLSVMMLVSLCALPASAYHHGIGSDWTLHKSAVLTENGTYTIHLDASRSSGTLFAGKSEEKTEEGKSDFGAFEFDDLFDTWFGKTTAAPEETADPACIPVCPSPVYTVHDALSPFFKYGDTCTVETNVSDVTVVRDAFGVTVSGFDFADGAVLEITITGVELCPIERTQKILPVNGNGCGIYNGTVLVEKFAPCSVVLPNAVYVADYARPMTVSVDDVAANEILHISAAPSAVSTYHADTCINRFGDAVYSEADRTLTYTPKTTNWNDYESFYLLSKNADSYEWSVISILPANNIFYEETMQDITYIGDGWEHVGTASNTEKVNGEMFGYIDALAEEGLHSDDTYSTSSKLGNKMVFTFTGTSLDVYGRTNSTTAVVYAQLRKVGSENLDRVLVVDTESVSGQYEQIPCVFFGDLPYATYECTIILETEEEFLVDGIRVYNPLRMKEVSNELVKTTYAEYGEQFSVNVPIRHLLITQPNPIDGTPLNGVVFIDKNLFGQVGTESSYISEYALYGPKNEVYLAPGQAIAFNVGIVEHNFRIGFKSPTAEPAQVSFTFGDHEKSEQNFSSASDLYYQVIPNSRGVIYVENTGDSLVAITKLRVTNPLFSKSALQAPEITASIPEITECAESFDTIPSVDYTDFPTVINTNIFEQFNYDNLFDSLSMWKNQ